jgi:hypothetical protein
VEPVAVVVKMLFYHVSSVGDKTMKALLSVSVKLLRSLSLQLSTTRASFLFRSTFGALDFRFGFLSLSTFRSSPLTLASLSGFSFPFGLFGFAFLSPLIFFFLVLFRIAQQPREGMSPVRGSSPLTTARSPRRVLQPTPLVRPLVLLSLKLAHT